MRFLKTQAIIIKRKNIGEADRLVTAITDRFGKLRFFAKGVRKTLSKHASALEPFLIIELSLVIQKNKTVTNSRIIKNFSFEKDVDKMALLFFVSDILDSLMPEDQANEALFLFFKKFLSEISRNSSSKIPLLSYFFVLNALVLSGYQSEFFYCINCFKKLKAGNKYYFNARIGGVICEKCHNIERQGSLSKEAIIGLRLLSKPNFSIVSKLRFRPKVEKEIKIVTALLLDEVLEREIKSAQFFKKVFNH